MPFEVGNLPYELFLLCHTSNYLYGTQKEKHSLYCFPTNFGWLLGRNVKSTPNFIFQHFAP